MKYFDRDEAEALIPELERIFSGALEIAAKARDKAQKLQKLEASGKDPAAIAIERSQLQHLARGVEAWLQKVVDLGAVPKGLEPPLVDFPSRLDGRTILLCWKAGEKEIGHYHTEDEGFSGRKPLPKTLH